MSDPIARVNLPVSPVSPVNPANPVSRLENNQSKPVIKRVNQVNNPAINRVNLVNPDRVANPAGREVAVSQEAINLAGKAVRLNRLWRP